LDKGDRGPSSKNKAQGRESDDSRFNGTKVLMSKIKLASSNSPSRSNFSNISSSPSKRQKTNDSDSALLRSQSSPMQLDAPIKENPSESPEPQKIRKLKLKECNHIISFSILEEKYKEVSKGTFFGKMNCIECNQQINMNDYLTQRMVNCRAKAIQDLELRFVHDVFESVFECQICGSEVLVKEGITIACIHRFCIDCFHAYIISMIEEGAVTGVKCPADDCLYKLSFYETKGVLQGSELELFEELITRNYKPKEINKRLYECLYCRTLVEVDKNTKAYRCIACYKKYCLTCNFDHMGITCAEYQKNLQLDLKGLNIIACPNCKQNFEGDKKGCNFMQCRCGSFFCRLCQKLLEKNDHHGSHYPQGPFLECVNKMV